jgi:hypothetical protein
VKGATMKEQREITKWSFIVTGSECTVALNSALIELEVL